MSGRQQYNMIPDFLQGMSVSLGRQLITNPTMRPLMLFPKKITTRVTSRSRIRDFSKPLSDTRTDFMTEG